jgi:hypothetical protein
MGGYAALLFGWLLKANIVHSFSPQTCLKRYFRILFLDARWNIQIKKVYNGSKSNIKYFDLKHLFTSQYNKSTEFFIHYSRTNIQDIIHARRMRRFPNVKLVDYQTGGHLIIKRLRDSGKLNTIIQETIQTII